VVCHAQDKDEGNCVLVFLSGIKEIEDVMVIIDGKWH
jgi:hypothetical protein